MLKTEPMEPEADRMIETRRVIGGGIVFPVVTLSILLAYGLVLMAAGEARPVAAGEDFMSGSPNGPAPGFRPARCLSRQARPESVICSNRSRNHARASGANAAISGTSL